MNDKITLHKDTNLFGVDLKAGEYVRKKEWVGLTDEEILKIEDTTTCNGNESWLRNLTRNLEAKLKEKNT